MKLSYSFLSDALPYASIQIGTISYGPIHGLSNELASWLKVHGDTFDLSIDTRTLKAGDIFLAVVGPNFDGHDYLADALDKGAKVLVVRQDACSRLQSIAPKLLDTKLVIVVPDTLTALTDLARCWRAQFSIPIIGITGSIGKTTIKEITRSILQVASMNACFNAGNQNNTIGLALNLLKLNSEHKVGIFEVGISHFGEMSALTDMLLPTMGLITTIAHAHVEGIGDLEAISFEKRQLFKHFKPDNVGIILGDQDLLAGAYYSHPIIKFGTKTKNQIQAGKVSIAQDKDGGFVTNFTLKIYKEKTAVSLAGNHSGIVINSLGAAAIAHFLGIDIKTIVEGLRVFKNVENRFQQKNIIGDRGVLISDCCNASPESMRAALMAFHKMSYSGPKIAVLGDMMELGKSSTFWHRQMGRVLGKALSINSVILIGNEAKAIAQTVPITMRTENFPSWQEAKQRLDVILAKEKALILVKASKAVGLEQMVKELSAST